LEFDPEPGRTPYQGSGCVKKEIEHGLKHLMPPTAGGRVAGDKPRWPLLGLLGYNMSLAAFSKTKGRSDLSENDLLLISWIHEYD
jgi:hypothetical protein